MIWDILIGVLFLGAARYGEYVSDECPQAGYACPKICDVDHKHLPREECGNKKTKGDTMPTNCDDLNLTPKERRDCKEYKGRFAKNKKVKSDKNIVPAQRY